MRGEYIHELTGREIEILQLIGAGYTSKEVAAKTFISEHTVSTHRRSILQKVGAKNIITVIILAIQERIINIESLETVA